ncbi:WxL protein peptidoglycan domain-containing protein [Cellulomonas soli]|uniref:WxL protein peptidoglycan domain-containing protein n=1 Tax=Cellulomonas soli TaxID=931535 RepID=UPI003F844DE5
MPRTVTRPRTRRTLAVLALALVGLLGPTMPAATADDTLSWSVRPADGEQGTARPNYQYALAAGDVVHDGFEVTNHGATPLTLRLYAADGFTTPEGQLDLLAAGEPSTDVGTWVTLERTELTLQPGEVAVVPFTLTVPADAAPGDHTGGVVTSVSTAGAGSTVVLDRRLGSRMHVRVQGELHPALAVGDVQVVHHGGLDPFRSGSSTVTFTVENTGNARTTAAVRVVLAGPGGLAPVQVSAAALPELLPGSVHTQQVEVAGVWPLGRLHARVELVPQAVGIGETAGRAVQSEAGTWAVPWSAVVLVLLVVVGALLGPRVLARVRRR